MTTTVSSMRTPPTPGRYTPGSTVTTEPGSNVSRALAATRGASWISRPTPWPVPCTNASAQPAAAITSRHARSTAAQSAPGAHRLASRPLALAHDVPHAARVGAGIADAHRARHVGAVAVDDATEVDDDELAALDAARARARVRLRRVRARTRRSGRSCCRSRRGDASRPRARARSRARSGRRRGAGAARRARRRRSRTRRGCGRPRPAPSPGGGARPGPRWRRARARSSASPNARCCDQRDRVRFEADPAPGSSGARRWRRAARRSWRRSRCAASTPAAPSCSADWVR